MRWLTLAIVALTLAACGGGGSGMESASAAVNRQFGFVIKGQWGREYDELHPGQQAIVAKDQFMSCNQTKNPGFTASKATEEFDEPIDVPGVAASVPARAVTSELTVGSQKTSVTVHEVNVDGHWHWVLPPKDIDAYKAGKCP